ncbi:MAG: DUF4363 family protein [Clostridia bacterium]|nr:DUF4363 family protein [Clostridia bacterium]
MKKYLTLIALMSLLIFILLLGWGTYKILDADTKTLLPSVEKISSAIQEENWTEAKNNFQKTEDSWNTISNHWAFLINHQEMDRIEESMAKLKGYIYCNDTINAQAEFYVLIHFIKHIPKKNTFNLENLF